MEIAGIVRLLAQHQEHEEDCETLGEIASWIEQRVQADPGERPIDILTRLEDHLAFVEWLLGCPMDFAAVLAGELHARELVGRYERRNDPPAPANEGGSP